MALPELNAVVTRRVDLTSELFILRVSPDGWELPDFEPGQFGVLGLPPDAPRSKAAMPEDSPPDPGKLIRRAYSISSSSKARQYLEFYVVLVKAGALTPRLHALKPGDRIWVAPKITGIFTLNDLPRDVNVILVATGTGLAPYMSMLRTHVNDGLWRRVAVLHGARQSVDLSYNEELTLLDSLHESVDYLPIISSPDQEPVPWQGVSGRVQDLWKNRVIQQRWGFSPSPEDTHFYLCGNPKMIEEMIELLGEDGFQEHTNTKPGQIHVERYW